MEFCPKCGAVLIMKTKNLGCPRCSYSKKGKSNIQTSEKIDAKEEVAVYSKKDEKVLPIVAEKCKKCKSEKAYFWTVQTRAGDEAETKFFKCVRCGHTWREYR
jgi:DNA-directed RNA polymerase subunit M